MNEAEARARSLEEIAAQLSLPVEAVELVESVVDDIRWHAVNIGMLHDPPHLTAAGFCRLLRTRVRKEFGAIGVEVLTGWGLERSEDIGRIVFALVANGWIEASPDDKLDDFNGLFEVSEYFVQSS